MLYNFVTCIGDIAFFMLDPLHLPTATFNPAMLSQKPFVRHAMVTLVTYRFCKPAFTGS
jgi:hypothetical protein